MQLHEDVLLTAPLTPMAAGGAVALDLIERQAEILLGRGTQGIYVGGNTGEGMLLTSAERVALAERWRAVLPESVPLIVHVGHGSVEEAKTLAAHAESIGADAVSAVGPTVFSCAKLETLVAWSEAIAGAAPRLPFFHYFLGADPKLHPCRASQYMTLAMKRIPNFAGVKYTHNDLLDLGDCLRLGGSRAAVLFGKDEALLPALSVGATGFVGGTYNLFSPLAREVIAAHRAGRHAAASSAFQRLQRAIGVLQRYGGLVALKAAMEAIGLPAGPPRLPLSPVDDQRKIKMIAELEQVWPQMVDATLGRVQIVTRD